MNAFLNSKSGSFVPIFGLLVVALFAVAGTGLDYSRASRAKQGAQDIADAMVLAAGAKILSGANTSDAKKEGINYYSANTSHVIYENGMNKELTLKALANDEFEINATITGTTETTFMAVAGIKDIDWSATATTHIGLPDVEIAFVPDISYSMKNGGKITSLKANLIQFVNSIYPFDKPLTKRRVSILPFADTINFGPEYKLWLDTDPAVSFESDYVGCFRPDPQSNMTNGDPPKSGGPGDYQAWKQTIRYNGYQTCADSASQATLFQYDPEKLKGFITDMSLAWGTATDIGLSWGWRVLSPKWRNEFVANNGYPKNYKTNGEKYLILLTDGIAKRYDWEGDGLQEGPSASMTDDWRTEQTALSFKAVCDAIKAEDKINVFMIGYKLEGADIDMKQYLENCTNGIGKYYDANPDDLSEILSKISFDINKFYLSG
jgi:Flp pilus assembly protein TadG